LSVPSVVRKGGREEDQELAGGPRKGTHVACHPRRALPGVWPPLGPLRRTLSCSVRREVETLGRWRAGSGKEEMLTTQGVFCHAQTQRLQGRIDLQVRPRDQAVWTEHEDGLGCRVDWERMGALHRAAALAGHAVTASGVGKPQIL
jgi:hypothetical protein